VVETSKDLKRDCSWWDLLHVPYNKDSLGNGVSHCLFYSMFKYGFVVLCCDLSFKSIANSKAKEDTIKS